MQRGTRPTSHSVGIRRRLALGSPTHTPAPDCRDPRPPQHRGSPHGTQRSSKRLSSARRHSTCEHSSQPWVTTQIPAARAWITWVTAAGVACALGRLARLTFGIGKRQVTSSRFSRPDCELEGGSTARPPSLPPIHTPITMHIPSPCRGCRPRGAWCCRSPGPGSTAPQSARRPPRAGGRGRGRPTG